jgi:membrane protease YdiL (CAAX protease family)
VILRAIVFYALSFVFTIVLGGVQEVAALSSETIILPQWGPGLAALLMLLLFRRDRHRLSIYDRRVPASRYALAVLVPTGVALVIYLLNTLVLGRLNFGDLAGTPWVLLLWMPLGAFGEELGWRGYLHKRLDKRLAGVVSSLIVGVLWALWHVGMYQNGMLYMAFFVLLIVSYTIVIYALVADTGFNVLVATIFHLMINVTNLLSFGVVNQVEFMAVNSLVWAAVALAVVMTRRSLFTARRATR